MPQVMHSKALIPFIIFGAIVALLGVALTLKPGEVPSPLIGKPAPDFVLPRLMDTAAKFSNNELAGEPWILNVWASWCVACRAEHSLLNALATAGTVKIVGLNYKDKRADAINWLSELGNPYHRVAVDLQGDVGIEFGVYGVPETFIIDSAGIVQLKHIGPLTQKDMRDTVVPLINRLTITADVSHL